MGEVKIHDHPLLADVPLQSETDDVRVSVKPRALLVPGYEMACGEPDPRIAAVYFQKHGHSSVNLIARAMESL